MEVTALTASVRTLLLCLLGCGLQAVDVAAWVAGTGRDLQAIDTLSATDVQAGRRMMDLTAKAWADLRGLLAMPHDDVSEAELKRLVAEKLTVLKTLIKLEAAVMAKFIGQELQINAELFSAYTTAERSHLKALDDLMYNWGDYDPQLRFGLFALQSCIKNLVPPEQRSGSP